MKVITFLLLLTPIFGYASLPEPELPLDIKSYWVAKHMELNDLPMNIRSFTTSIPLELLQREMTIFLENISNNKIQEAVDTEGWVSLSAASREAFYVVKLKSNGLISEGLFTVSALGKKKVVEESFPNGVLRIQKQRFLDGPHTQEFEVFSTLSGRAEARVLIEQIMKKRGWYITRRHDLDVQLFVRNRDYANVVMQDNESGVGTLILISKELSK